MKHIKLLKILPIITALVLLASCNTQNDEPVYDSYLNFATLESLYSGGCSFRVQESNSSSPVILTSTSSLPTNFTVGNRYVIQYSNENAGAYVSGPISLLYALTPFGGDATVATSDSISKLMSDNISVPYIKRIGRWLDVQAFASVSYQPNVFGVFVDEATVKQEYPEAYLGFRTDFSNGSQYVLYGSFNISPIMGFESAKGFNLHYKFNNIWKTEKIEF